MRLGLPMAKLNHLPDTFYHFPHQTTMYFKEDLKHEKINQLISQEV